MPEEKKPETMGEAWAAAFGSPGVLIPVGKIVICDDCNADWTDRKESGGLLFESKAICPDCEPKWRKLAAEYHEEEYIRGACPELQAFADWVREMRGPDAGVRVSVGPLR